MPKINWNIYKTKFDGKEQETFEFLSYILFLREFDQPVGIERYKDQTGIETEPIQINGEWIGFQAKFYETKISTNKQKIKNGIKKAKAKNPQLAKIYFYLNQEFSESPKRGKKKSDDRIEIEDFAKSQKVEIVWRVPSHFEAQAYDAKNKDLARDFFTLSAEPEFDEAAFDDYLQAVEKFSFRTPYLALNQMLSGARRTLDEIYVPLPFQISAADSAETKDETTDETKDDATGESDSQILAGERSTEARQDEKSKPDIAPATKIVSSVSGLVKELKTRKSQQHVLLQGTAGAGKSTVLHRIARDARTNPDRLGLSEPHLPLIVRLRTLAGVGATAIEEKLSEGVRLGGDIVTLKKFPENFFSEWSREKGTPWLVMLDGLDEVAADARTGLLQWIGGFVAAIKNQTHLIVLTSRPLSDQQFQDLGKNFLIGNLLAFDRDQQKAFAVRWFPDRAEDFLAKVERLSQPESVFREKLTMTPLLLTIAAVVYERRNDLPETGQNELYENFVEILFDEARERGLKDELGGELFGVAQPALERLALEMTDQSEKNSFADLSRICSEFIQETLNHYSAASAESEGEKLCEALTRRSGILYRQGDVCLWVHATMREYLAARALNRQIEREGQDFQAALGERILDGKNYEMLLAFSRNFARRMDLVEWMCRWAREKTSADAANVAYDIWEESDENIRLALRKDVILALGSSFGDRRAGMSLETAIENVLIQMGEPAVEPLLELLAEYDTLQSRLVPDWINLDERPDIKEEVDEKLRGGYSIRMKIIKILGDIGDGRVVEPVIELVPQKTRPDEYRFDVSRAARKALGCIGRPALAPLLSKIRDKNTPIDGRCDYLRCLTEIGIRTEEISDALGEILREGLAENEKLLAAAITAANVLRDEKQAKFVKSSLAELNNTDVIGRAAAYFSRMPNESVSTLLEAAFAKHRANFKEKDYATRDVVERIARVILASGEEQSRNSVLEFLKDNLRTSEILYPREVLNLLRDSKLQIVSEFFVRELARHLNSPEPDDIVDDLLGEIAQMYQPEQLESLARAVESELAQVQNGEENFVAKLIALGNETPHFAENQRYPLSARIKESELVRTLANCRVPDFARHAARLLNKPHFTRSIELCRVLWVAGETSAEPFLLQCLRRLVGRRKPEQESAIEEYYAIRALATCGNKKGAGAVISFIRKNPRLSIYLPDEVLRPLVRRKMIGTDEVSRMALNRRGTHEYVRNFCLETLGGIDVPEFTDVFLDALANETYDEAQACAAHILGWTNAKRKKEVVRKLEDELKNSSSAYVASRAGRSLVRLKSKKSLELIEKTILRFGGPEKMSDLLRAAAQFRAASTFELIKDFHDDVRLYSRTDQNIIAAVGEYYKTQERAREIVKGRFEASYKDYDSGRQQIAAVVLIKNDPNCLTRRAVEMYDEETLEPSAKLQIIEFGGTLGKATNLNQTDFAELYKRFLCDEDLTVREKASESLNFVQNNLRRKIYDELQTVPHEWVRGCLIYSLAFWQSDAGKIARARFDESKIVRHFADAAGVIRAKRDGLEKAKYVFRETTNAAERVAAYLTIAEEANESHFSELRREIAFEHPAHIFLRSLGEHIERRVKEERKKREKSEQDNFCARAKEFKF